MSRKRSKPIRRIIILLLWRSLLAGRAINDRVVPQDPFFDPADACSPDCRVFLNPREVSLKNYVFRTGLNWRFDWGKAPVAVMAKY